MRDLTEPAPADFATGFATASYGRLIGDHELAHELAAQCVARCRSAGMLRWLATSLHLLAQTQLSLGRHRDALASATEGLQVCQHAGLDHRASYLRATLAALAGLTGDGGRCRELAAQSLDYAQAHGIGTAAANARWALAMLDLATGQPDAAHEQLTAARAALGQHPVLTAFLVPDLVEAAVRAHRAEAATETVAAYQKWAAAVGQPGATALAARCLALIATDDQAERHFTAATLDHPFEQARTDLLHGEWLRRGRRRTESRRRLRAALEAFEKLDADPWSERARAELRATGETIDQTTKTGTPLGRLTPQEREVARLAAAGATNKEIAAQLFLSPRTVGHHLYRAFPKLGITSRAQLTEIIT
jgi:DNA-binding CsgD family transcriptional regulator